jgi:hypothetical protein
MKMVDPRVDIHDKNSPGNHLQRCAPGAPKQPIHDALRVSCDLNFEMRARIGSLL